jgi:putative DNA primase/helicase
MDMPITGSPDDLPIDHMVDDALTIARLSQLSPLEYDRIRKTEAARMSVRPDTLDSQVRRHRADPRTPINPETPLNEDGIALAFTERYRDWLRFCHTTKNWYEWSGVAWRKDEVKKAFSWARKTCRQIARDAGAGGDDLSKIAKAAFAGAVERYAQSDEAFGVTAANWDSDPWVIGTPDGTLDLKSGVMRAANPSDHITKLTGVGPAETADCPLWLKFLHEATGGNADLIRFLQQWCGYTLTGVTIEHALLFVYGPGGNGKSVFLNVLNGILGEYAKTAPMDSFTASLSDKHPTDMAGMKGARLVTASETEEGRAWAEAKIKALTGGDIISARFIARDFFEFKPEFKLTIVGNHKPVFRNVDDAMKRRFNVVPFIFKPAKPDKELETKLQAEWPAIFRWMMDGCLDWQREGLLRPRAVLEATATYFAEQDLVGQWVEECCNLGPRESETMAELFKSWSSYAIANGEKPGTTKWFSQIIARSGGEPVKHTPGHNGKRGFRGISVKLETTRNHYEAQTDYDDQGRY